MIRAVVAASLCAFAVLTVLVTLGWAPLVRLDGMAVEQAHLAALREPQLHGAATVVTTAGSPLGVSLLVTAGGLVLLVLGRVRLAGYLVVARVVELGVNHGAKRLVSRARPDVASPADIDRLSFPSGHTASAAVVCVALLVLALPALHSTRRRVLTVPVAVLVTVLALGVVGAVGASRVLLGVHYPTDVLGGALLGAICALVIAWTMGVVSRPPTAPASWGCGGVVSTRCATRAGRPGHDEGGGPPHRCDR